MSPLRALETLRLIERAHVTAKEAAVYGRASSADAFVCEWEIPRPARAIKKLGVITHDEVKEDRLRSVVEDCGDVFSPLWLRDPPPNAEFDAVLIDWDSLDPEGREKLLSALLSNQHRPPIGLYSYNVDPADAAVLRRKGITVLDRLEPDAVAWLLNGT
jgi:hypothetical protein